MKSKAKSNGPIKVKVANAVVKIYPGEYEKNGKGYQRYSIAYYLNGKRKIETRPNESKARQRANELATQIARGHLDVLSLTNSDRDNYIAAMNLLQPLGVPLHVAIQEYVAAYAHLHDESLLSAVKARSKQRQSYREKPIGEIVSELLKDKKENGVSVRYIQSLRSHLSRFAAAFHCNIGSVTAGLIEHYLLKLKTGPRTRNNNRLSIVTLFHFAQKHKYLPKNQPTEADAVDKAKDRGGNPEILKPEQMVKLMRKSRGKVALYLALAGFGGIRAAEILRLEWKDFNFVRGHITIAKEKAKTATRRLVPILPNLAEYLRPYHRMTGNVFKPKDDKRAIDFARKHGVNPWPTNALRHSYATYRLAATSDTARVALEMGNSPQKLMTNYRELADEHDASAWFAIAPKRPKNVLVMAS